jgi:glycogen debranching enzyme
MLRALARVLSPTGFPYASGFHLFKDAHFGRDSLEVAEDLLEVRPDIARAVILRLATLQGTATDRLTEEQPGKIHHEYRALTIDGKPVDAESRAIFRTLAQHWRLADTPEGLDALTEYIYYGTVDATPLYVRLIARYCDAIDAGILDAEYTPRGSHGPGSRLTIRDSVRRAVDWIVGELEGSELGLLEFQRVNPKGHRFQAWKDGMTSYLHTDGTFANYNGPIASIEVQGLAYDALTAAPDLLTDSSAADHERWRALAAHLRDALMDLFWMPDERFFAMALDRDPVTGNARQIRTVTSNPGSLLDSGIFDRMPSGERQRVVGAIVERIYSGEFLTAVGVRCSSLRHQDLLDYAGYQSSHTVWHKETYDIAKGLRRQGFPGLAEDLETRLLNAVTLTGAATEFLYVLADGRADLDPFGKHAVPGSEEILGTNIPENDQAWSISAALAIKWRRGRRVDGGTASGWQRDLEEEKRRAYPPAPLLRWLRDIEQSLGGGSAVALNKDEGWRRESAFVRAHELPRKSM